MLSLLALLIFGLILFWLSSFVYTSFKGSPYVPLPKERLKTITSFIKPGDHVADLGCGDGRILIEAVKQGASFAQGWESDFLVYLTALWRTRKSGVDHKKIKIHFGDMWRADLSQVDIVYLYQMTKYMGPVKSKILPQLKPGTLIISPDYQIPGLKFHQHLKDNFKGVYLYQA